jgi:hypothetical protein
VVLLSQSLLYSSSLTYVVNHVTVHFDLIIPTRELFYLTEGTSNLIELEASILSSKGTPAELIKPGTNCCFKHLLLLK